MTDSPATGARRKPLRLAMEIDAPATPRHVVEAAYLFADGLQAIAPELGDDDVTLVVSNRELRSELRGYSEAGRAAVGSLTSLFEDPEAAVRSNRRLFDAAAVVAKRLAPLIPYSPRIYRGQGKKPIVTLTSLYSQRIAAMSILHAAGDQDDMAGGITGETVVHAPILRFGRSSESAVQKATIRVFGKLLDVEVQPDLALMCGQLVGRAEEVAIRLRGRWVPSGDSLELKDPSICGLDSEFQVWSGSDFIEEVRANSQAFSGEDLEQIRDGLRNLRE